MKPLLIAYATNEGIRLMNREDARRLTHINLAFGVIRDGLPKAMAEALDSAA